MKNILFLMSFIFVSLTASAQYHYKDSNRIGIFFGVNQFTLNTTNFDTKPASGWNAGLSLRGNFYDNWDMVYAMQFSENNFMVATSKLNIKEDANYNLSSAQVTLQISYKLIENHLSIEFGPVIQINGKLKPNYDQENNIISGTTLLVKDIVDISKFNFYPTLGITASIRHLRASISYQYGVNNMLENLNTKGYGVNFKGNSGIINGNLILYL
jgi:hypothetical protein